MCKKIIFIFSFFLLADLVSAQFLPQYRKNKLPYTKVERNKKAEYAVNDTIIMQDEMIVGFIIPTREDADKDKTGTRYWIKLPNGKPIGDVFISDNKPLEGLMYTDKDAKEAELDLTGVNGGNTMLEYLAGAFIKLKYL